MIWLNGTSNIYFLGFHNQQDVFVRYAFFYSEMPLFGGMFPKLLNFSINNKPLTVCFLPKTYPMKRTRRCVCLVYLPTLFLNRLLTNHHSPIYSLFTPFCYERN